MPETREESENQNARGQVNNLFEETIGQSFTYLISSPVLVVRYPNNISSFK